MVEFPFKNSKKVNYKISLYKTNNKCAVRIFKHHSSQYTISFKIRKFSSQVYLLGLEPELPRLPPCSSQVDSLCPTDLTL